MEIDLTVPEPEARDNPERVVKGAHPPSPYLGKLSARLLDRPVFLRELMPQDMKLKIEDMDPLEAIKATH